MQFSEYFIQFDFVLLYPRGNKLGLWTHVKDGEALTLSPITSPPLCNEAVKMIQTGTSHSAFITGISEKFWMNLASSVFLASCQKYLRS